MKPRTKAQKLKKAEYNKAYRLRLKANNVGMGFRKNIHPSEKAFLERLKSKKKG